MEKWALTSKPQSLFLGGKGRFVTNVRFRPGEEDDSCMDLEMVNLYCHEGSLAEHLNPGSFPVGKCSDCREEARQRTIAVAHGLFSISLTESIPDYGYSVCYTTEHRAGQICG